MLPPRYQLPHATSRIPYQGFLPPTPRYAMSGTESAYSPMADIKCTSTSMSLRARYDMAGTDPAYCPTGEVPRLGRTTATVFQRPYGTDCSLPTRVLCDVRY
eukprot:1136743-Rhodomonas_salina.2